MCESIKNLKVIWSAIFSVKNQQKKNRMANILKDQRVNFFYIYLKKQQ